MTLLLPHSSADSMQSAADASMSTLSDCEFKLTQARCSSTSSNLRRYQTILEALLPLKPDATAEHPNVVRLVFRIHV